MANALQICRICLSVNIKMFTLKNTNMENLYKLLTQVYINIEDGKPTTVCFLCHARLQQCDRLQQQAIKSNEILEQLLRRGLMQETANVILSNQYTSQDLQVSSTYYLNLEPTNCEDVFLDPKVETNGLILIKKEEVRDVGHNVTDFSEDANDPIDFASVTIHSNSEYDQPLITECSNKCDGIKNIVCGMKNWRKEQEEENMYIIQSEKEVENDPYLCNSTQTQQKNKTFNNNEEAEGINIKSGRNLVKEKNVFSTKSQKGQKHINNDANAEVDLILEEPKTNAIPNKQKINENIQKGNINGAKTFVIDTVPDEFHCNECGKQFFTKDILTDHILKCVKTNQISVSDSQLMKANTLKSLLSDMYSCDICSYNTYNKRCLETHLRMHNVVKVFSCNICEYRCVRKNDLKRHMKKHTGKPLKPFSCNICEYKGTDKGKLKIHMIKHTDKKPFSCNICEWCCARKSDLKRHMKNHSGEKPFSCNICEYMCAHKFLLKVHMNKHTGEKPFFCNICEYRCALKSNLKRHIRTHTTEKDFSCNICEYRSGQKQHLMDHIKTHTSDKPFSCNICEYRCTQKRVLNQHIKTHTGEKHFSCNICEYRCLKKSNLNLHMKIHTGEKPYSCNNCGYRCAHKHHLIAHIRTHTGEKPFSCNICEYKCAHKLLLIQHIRTHTGEKPFSCNICEYRCARKNDLKRHIRKHTIEKHFSCNICWYRCACKSDLKTHEKTCRQETILL